MRRIIGTAAVAVSLALSGCATGGDEAGQSGRSSVPTPSHVVAVPSMGEWWTCELARETYAETRARMAEGRLTAETGGSALDVLSRGMQAADC